MRSTLEAEPGRNKSQALTDALRAMAVRLGAGAKLPTVSELRGTLGVSQATVTAALSVLEGEAVIVRRPGSGIYVSPDVGRKTIALLLNRQTFRAPNRSPFWDVLTREVERRAAEHKEVLQMHFTQADNQISPLLRRYLKRSIERGELHGFLGVALHRESSEWLEEQGVALVNLFGAATVTVFIDEIAMLQMGAEVLARDCRRAALWWPAEPQLAFADWMPSKADDDRRDWKSAWDAHGLQADENGSVLFLERQKPGVAPLECTAEQGRVAVQRCFDRPRAEWPQGVLIMDDMMASGALREMRARGVRPGTDVQIVTHFNRGMDVLQGEETRLHRLETDPHEVVVTLFERLERLLKGELVEPPWLYVRPHLRVAEEA